MFNFINVISNILGFGCGNASTLCEAVEADVQFASLLAKRYPTKVFLLRYEDFVLKPYRTLDVVLNFLELLPEPCMDTYLETHTGITRQKLLANMTKNTYYLLIISMLFIMICCKYSLVLVQTSIV